MITTKTLTRTALVLLAGTLAPAAVHAAIDIADSATYYDVENWYGYRSNVNIGYDSGDSSISFSQVDSASYLWAYFDPILLDVGDTLTFSGTFTFGTIASGGKFFIGLFNSGLCAQSQMLTHTYQSGTDVSSMENYSETTKTDGTVSKKSVTGTATGGMTGVSANSATAYLRTNAASNTAFLSTSSGAQQKNTDFTSAFSEPSANSAYNVSLELKKTETGLDFSVAFDGAAAQTISFETDIKTFDVLGIRAPTTSTGGITLSNVSVTTTGTVIPEPSAFGLLAGAFALALAGTRRRRRR